MTQLDGITWMGQIIWLFVILSSLYVFFYNYYGPFLFISKICRTLKIKSHYKSFIFYSFLNIDTRFKYYNIIVSNF